MITSNFDLGSFNKELIKLVTALVMKHEELDKGVRVLNTITERSPSTDGKSTVFHIHIDVQSSKEPE